ncbi:hypothetical protein [Ruminiclostridium cellobioparum]|uniref:hypothetical protein n=1 Tax=Ruminiclostridium cellobioparum TaxID=29355 RepID=UPI00054EC459|nr:hypothetical protein [Ruminiclostridium cellobioparum]
MNKIDEAINSIRSLECPTGQLENKVAGILEKYGVAGRTQINIDRSMMIMWPGLSMFTPTILSVFLPLI